MPLSSPVSSPLASDLLRTHLLRLPYPAFARIVCTLLTRLGYQDVELLGIAEGKGRNSFGGLDVQAYAQTGLTRSLVIGQIKQYKEAVPRCFMDELRGAMLRLGAAQGLILTTGNFAPAARDAAQMAQHAAPVRLLDGDALAALLREHAVAIEDIAPAPRKASQTRKAPAPGVEAPTPAAATTEPERQMTLTLRFLLPVAQDSACHPANGEYPSSATAQNRSR